MSTSEPDEATPAPEPAPPAATSGAGTPLVLLHAFPLDGRMWAPQVEALAGSYQVIVPDLSSPVFWVDGTLVWGFTAGLLVGFLDALGLQAPPLPTYWGTRP